MARTAPPAPRTAIHSRVWWLNDSSGTTHLVCEEADACEGSRIARHSRLQPGIGSASMDRTEVRALLARVAAGELDVESALGVLAAGPFGDGAGFTDLDFARIDTHRALRTGDPEVVYAAGKTADQVVAILTALRDAPGARPALATRLDDATVAA